MRSVICPAAVAGAPRVRMLWLPGAYHGPDDFVAAGFGAAAARRAPHMELLLLEPHLRHLHDRECLADLYGHVLAAREPQVAVWLAGISLGAALALAFLADHAQLLDGIVLLAPYLGDRMLIGEIARAGGLELWQPGELAQHDEQRRIWHLIQTRALDSVPLLLGYGTGDRFAAGHNIMATALPHSAVHTISGGHDWPTWSLLWETVLDRHFT